MSSVGYVGCKLTTGFGCRQLKAKDFEGYGGPEDKKILEQDRRGGHDDVKGQTMRDWEKH